MSAASDSREINALRRDLTSIPVADRARSYRIVVDEISGRFTRVSERLWQRLCAGEDDDAELLSQAHAAGWLRSRETTAKKRFTPLWIRIRLGSIDWLAKSLENVSGVVFAPRVIAFWLIFIAVVAVAVLSRSDALLVSLQSLPEFLTQVHPLSIVLLFVVTKFIHELAHAVMCRRMGGRPGDVGILLLCGIPCPYCDVTDIWRQPSAIKRAAVMLAGIYIELIIAAGAAVVWLASHDHATQLTALNVMLLCSISTILFNANPLMRYDGYYVLADLLRSVSLRTEARSAFRNVIVRRIAGPGYGAGKKHDRRSLFLSVFHLASSLYRVIVLIAIAALLVQYASWFQLRNLALAIVTLATLLAATGSIRKLGGVICGKGTWQHVSWPRRVAPSSLMVLLFLLLLLIPLPRFRRAAGVVDAADTYAVFIPEDGVVGEVSAEFGQAVGPGDPLARLDRSVMQVQEARLQGQVRMAELRLQWARRFALDQKAGLDGLQQWNMLTAAQRAAKEELAATHKRIRDGDLRSPVSGVVLPATARFPDDDQKSSFLADQLGTSVASGQTWCRVGCDGKLHAVFLLDAADRTHLRIGSPVVIHLPGWPQKIVHSQVASVSAIEQVDAGANQLSAYQVICPLPAVSDDQLLWMIGQQCRAVFHLPRRSLAATTLSWMEGWAGG